VSECQTCHIEYSLRDGQEPTKHCDECAHDHAERLESVVSDQADRIAALERALELCKLWHQGDKWRDKRGMQGDSWRRHMDMIDAALSHALGDEHV
jgi:hypothetical protein